MNIPKLVFNVFSSPSKTSLKDKDQKPSLSSHKKKQNSETTLTSSSKLHDSRDYDSSVLAITPKTTSSRDSQKAQQEAQPTPNRVSVFSSYVFEDNQTEDLMKLTEASKQQTIKLHCRKMEAVQRESQPILFVKGGYNKYVDIKSTKSNCFRKSFGQKITKGGFQIVEDNNLKLDFSQLARNRGSGSRLSFGGYDRDPLNSPRADIIEVRGGFRSSLNSARHSEVDPLQGSQRFGEIRVSLSGLNAGDMSSRSTITPGSVLSPMKMESPFCIRNFSNSKASMMMQDEASHMCISFDQEDLEIDEAEEFATDPQLLQTILIEEYKSLHKHQLYFEKIYVIPTSNTMVWTCLIFIGGGYYEKGKFKFNIMFPQDFPAESVKVYSLTKIYHPLINIETGEVDLKFFNEPSQDKIANLALFLKSIFHDSKYLEKSCSFNCDAGIKYSKSPYYFKIKAQESVKLSQDNTMVNNDNKEKALAGADLVKSITRRMESGSGAMAEKVNNLIEQLKKEAASKIN